MNLKDKNLKALGFEMKDGQLVPIDDKPIKSNNNKIVKSVIRKQVTPNIKKQVSVPKERIRIDYAPPKINTKNPFYKYLDVETLEHIKVVHFLQENHSDKVWFHPMNEGKRSTFERYKMSLMGTLKGITDFVIAHPKFKDYNEGGRIVRKIVHLGLFLELKAPEHNRVVQKGKKAGHIVKAVGKASAEQIEVMNKLNLNGYKACICYGANDAIKELIEYFRKD